jgi:hypothetical protein
LSDFWLKPLLISFSEALGVVFTCFMSSYLGHWLGAEDNVLEIAKNFNDCFRVVKRNKRVAFVFLLGLRWQRHVLDRAVSLEELQEFVC